MREMREMREMGENLLPHLPHLPYLQLFAQRPTTYDYTPCRTILATFSPEAIATVIIKGLRKSLS
jgi:hypothetical protein